VGITDRLLRVRLALSPPARRGHADGDHLRPQPLTVASDLDHRLLTNSSYRSSAALQVGGACAGFPQRTRADHRCPRTPLGCSRCRLSRTGGDGYGLERSDDRSTRLYPTHTTKLWNPRGTWNQRPGHIRHRNLHRDPRWTRTRQGHTHPRHCGYQPRVICDRVSVLGATIDPNQGSPPRCPRSRYRLECPTATGRLPCRTRARACVSDLRSIWTRAWPDHLARTHRHCHPVRRRDQRRPCTKALAPQSDTTTADLG
jgi:hypothetical protein